MTDQPDKIPTHLSGFLPLGFIPTRTTITIFTNIVTMIVCLFVMTLMTMIITLGARILYLVLNPDSNPVTIVNQKIVTSLISRYLEWQFKKQHKQIRQL